MRFRRRPALEPLRKVVPPPPAPLPCACGAADAKRRHLAWRCPLNRPAALHWRPQSDTAAEGLHVRLTLLPPPMPPLPTPPKTPAAPADVFDLGDDCPRCGYEAAPEDNFCAGCGLRLLGPAAVEVPQFAGYTACTEFSKLTDVCDRGAVAVDSEEVRRSHRRPHR